MITSKTNLRPIIGQFFEVYLKKQRNVSPNTLLSYRDAFKLLITYLIEHEAVNRKRIFLEDLTKNRILNFLEWLETARGSKATTRNQRLAAIWSFIHFIEFQHPELSLNFDGILNIPKKKAKPKFIEHLTKDQVQILLNQINRSTYKGLRDLTLLALMYDSGARVQELIDLKKSDFNDFKPPSITLTGKGRKYRTVVISDSTRDLLRSYLATTRFESPDSPLFFSFRGRRKLTRQGVQFVLNKYVALAHSQNASFLNMFTVTC